MAEVVKAVAATTTLPLEQLPFHGGSVKGRTVVKRKTPSELREEQLKRRIMPGDGNGSVASLGNIEVLDSESKKPEGPRITRYVDMRLHEVYSARKPNIRASLLSIKLNLKDNQVVEEKSGMKSCSSLCLTAENDQALKSMSASVASATVNVSQRQTSDDHDAKFCSVAELSFGCDKFALQGSVDMDKALKGLAAHENSGSSSPTLGGKSDDLKAASLGKFPLEMCISGSKVPLDVTLKTTMRIVSSSPVDRFHRLLMGNSYIGMTPFSFQSGYSGSPSFSCRSTSRTFSDSFGLHSWIYPQSSLPPSVMSVLSSSKGEGDVNFLNKRQLSWEDSFRCLYYTLRKSGCNIFYVCTSQFVAMFTAVGGIEKSRRICNAYISKSTRGLRSLLQEHDICFSMPLCSNEMEQISREDLVELSEIEKHNLGQAKRIRSMPDVDNSPRSLLAFNGNDSVHGLYDFLLNYRSLLTMMTSADVPVLCAPIPFPNAAHSSPEVRCKEFKRADVLQSKCSTSEDESVDGSTSGICYSIEIKDTYLPPWTVCSISKAIASDGRVFEASFVTEPNSMGLNAALEAGNQKCDSDETSGDSEVDDLLSISGAMVCAEMGSATLKSLKYSNGSYLASLFPV